MEFHRGRLFDHVHPRVKDLDASKRLHRAVLTQAVAVEPRVMGARACRLLASAPVKRTTLRHRARPAADARHAR